MSEIDRSLVVAQYAEPVLDVAPECLGVCAPAERCNTLASEAVAVFALVQLVEQRESEAVVVTVRTTATCPGRRLISGAPGLARCSMNLICSVALVTDESPEPEPPQQSRTII